MSEISKLVIIDVLLLLSSICFATSPFYLPFFVNNSQGIGGIVLLLFVTLPGSIAALSLSVKIFMNLGISLFQKR
ncbi:MAG: hypothetical protein AAF569_04345 [Pseudomonadota bacterium]